MVSLLNLFGVIGITGGLLGYFGYPVGLKMGIDSMLNLGQDGMIYPVYMKPPFPTNVSYYIYEITNPKDVLVGGKAKLRLRGPFRFNTYIYRDKIVYSKSGEIVSYDSRRQLVLREEGSADLDQKFWQINPILPAIAQTVRSIVLDKVPFRRMMEPIVFNSVNLLLDQYKERLIVKRSARQVLLGFKINLLEDLTKLMNRFSLQGLMPPGPPDNIFGVVYIQNITVDNVEIYAGVGSTKDKFAEVIKWNDKEKIKFWRGKCQTIAGTNGELYKPFLQPGKSIRIFLPQLCRSFDLDSLGEITEIHNGLKALEFELSPRLYMGARNNPDNKCFCTDTRNYDCQYDGLINMGPCFFESPIFLTKANMRGVDKRIRDLLHPDSFQEPLSDKQSFYLDPTTGAVLKVNLTLMSVLKVTRQPYMRDMARIQNLTYFPFFAVTETLEIDGDLGWQIKALQTMTTYYKPMYAAMGAGGTSLLVLKFITSRFF